MTTAVSGLSSSVCRTVVSALIVFAAACSNAPAPTRLLRLVTEPAGANCAAGGIAVQTGADANANGVLDDAEVTADQTKYLCNGTTGAAGKDGKDGATGPMGAPGPAGDAGANGADGVAGANGAAGQPGDAGANGYNALAKITAEPAGRNCTYGGSRVDVGLDTNRNNSLEETEVSSTSYVCDQNSISALYFGDVHVTSAADLAVLDHVQIVVGSIYLEAPFGTQLSLPDLKQIVGDFNLTVGLGGSDSRTLVGLTTVSLPALTRVSSISVVGQEDLTGFSAPALTTADHVYFDNNQKLDTISLPSLVTASNVTMYANSKLTTLTLPSLTKGQLDVWGNALLTRLDAPLLATWANTLAISDNSVLETISLPSLESGDSLYLNNNANTSLALAKLKTLTGQLSLSSNSLLTLVELPALTQVNQLYVGNNAVLATLTLTALTKVFSTFTVVNNPKLDTCAVLRLASALTTSNVTITGNDSTNTCTHADRCRVVAVTGITDTIEVCFGHRTWADARTECKSTDSATHKGDLVWFASSAEFLAYRALVGTAIPGDSWVGLTDEVTEGTFLPIGPSSYNPATDSSFTFWNSGEPNDSGGNEDYAGLYQSGAANDFSGTSQLATVCRGWTP